MNLLSRQVPDKQQKHNLISNYSRSTSSAPPILSSPQLSESSNVMPQNHPAAPRFQAPNLGCCPSCPHHLKQQFHPHDNAAYNTNVFFTVLPNGQPVNCVPVNTFFDPLRYNLGPPPGLELLHPEMFALPVLNQVPFPMMMPHPMPPHPMPGTYFPIPQLLYQNRPPPCQYSTDRNYSNFLPPKNLSQQYPPPNGIQWQQSFPVRPPPPIPILRSNYAFLPTPPVFLPPHHLNLNQPNFLLAATMPDPRVLFLTQSKFTLEYILVTNQFQRNKAKNSHCNSSKFSNMFHTGGPNLSSFSKTGNLLHHGKQIDSPLPNSPLTAASRFESFPLLKVPSSATKEEVKPKCIVTFSNPKITLPNRILESLSGHFSEKKCNSDYFFSSTPTMKIFNFADHLLMQRILSIDGGCVCQKCLISWNLYFPSYKIAKNEYRIFSGVYALLKLTLDRTSKFPWHIFSDEALLSFPNSWSQDATLIIAGADYKTIFNSCRYTELENLTGKDKSLLEAYFFDIMMTYTHYSISTFASIEKFLKRCWAQSFFVADLFLPLSLLSPPSMTPPPTTALPQNSICHQTSLISNNIMCPPRSSGTSTIEDVPAANLPNGDMRLLVNSHGSNFGNLYAASKNRFASVNNFYPEYENYGSNKSNTCIDDRSTTLPTYPLTQEENPECTHELLSGLKALHYVMDLRQETDEKEELEQKSSNKVPSWTTLQLSGGLRFISTLVFELTYLTQLHVSHNGLLTLSRDIAKLVNLKVLDVSHNCLCYLPSTLSLIQLDELYVQHNGIYCLPNELGRATKLKVLKADNNPLDPEVLKFFEAKLDVSKIIDFFRARLDSIPPRVERLFSYFKHEGYFKYPKFSILCYNILCRHYASSSHYPWCPPWALDWRYRRSLALQEIEAYLADIVAFQEIDGAEYEETFKPRLTALGYTGVFYCKTRARSMGKDHSMVDGCAIFFKTSKFELADQRGVDISNSPIESANAQPLCYFGNTPVNGIRETPNTIMINRMMPRDNIGIVLTLVPKTGFYHDARNENSQHHPETNAVPIVVATTHFHWDPDHCDVKAIQALSLVNCIRKQVNEVMKAKNIRREEVPVLVLGDFNSLPGSAVTDYLGHNSVRKNHEEFKEFANIDLSRFACTSDRYHYHHSLNLSNVMERKPLDYTNYTTKFVGTIDHVFVTAESIRPVRTLDPVPISVLKANNIEGFPNPNTPSDHIPIYIEFSLVDPQDVVQNIVAREEETQGHRRNNEVANRVGRQTSLPNYLPNSGI